MNSSMINKIHDTRWCSAHSDCDGVRSPPPGGRVVHPGVQRGSRHRVVGQHRFPTPRHKAVWEGSRQIRKALLAINWTAYTGARTEDSQGCAARLG
jgi:hypothetical protein